MNRNIPNKWPTFKVYLELSLSLSHTIYLLNDEKCCKFYRQELVQVLRQFFKTGRQLIWYFNARARVLNVKLLSMSLLSLSLSYATHIWWYSIQLYSNIRQRQLLLRCFVWYHFLHFNWKLHFKPWHWAQIRWIFWASQIQFSIRTRSGAQFWSSNAFSWVHGQQFSATKTKYVIKSVHEYLLKCIQWITKWNCVFFCIDHFDEWWRLRQVQKMPNCSVLKARFNWRPMIQKSSELDGKIRLLWHTPFPNRRYIYTITDRLMIAFFMFV